MIQEVGVAGTHFALRIDRLTLVEEAYGKLMADVHSHYVLLENSRPILGLGSNARVDEHADEPVARNDLGEVGAVRENPFHALVRACAEAADWPAASGRRPVRRARGRGRGGGGPATRSSVLYRMRRSSQRGLWSVRLVAQEVRSHQDTMLVTDERHQSAPLSA